MAEKVEKTKEQIVELVRDMLKHTVDRGCTPSEAAGFAAHAAKLIERWQIDQAELHAGDGDAPEIEVCQNTLRTGKKVFNPGMTGVISGLAVGMCCRVILLHQHGEAVYGIVGDTMDADYVCTIATTVVPALQIMADLEGREHGREKAGLVRWANQYLQGAGAEIRKRLESERKARADAKLIEAQQYSGGRALMVVTGETLALAKREAVEESFKVLYPFTKTTYSRSSYDHDAATAGRAAGKRVGLHVGLEGGT